MTRFCGGSERQAHETSNPNAAFAPWAQIIQVNRPRHHREFLVLWSEPAAIVDKLMDGAIQRCVWRRQFETLSNRAIRTSMGVTAGPPLLKINCESRMRFFQ
jgi:hypothetical protein